MAGTKIPTPVKQEAQAEIAEILEHRGHTYDWGELATRHGIHRATIYRF